MISLFCLTIERNLKYKILDKICKLPYLKFIDKNSSYYLNNYITISSQFSNSILQNFLLLASHTIIAFGIFIFLLYINFYLTVIFTISIVLVYFLYYLLTKKKLEEFGDEINSNSKKVSKLSKNFYQILNHPLFLIILTFIQKI